MKRVLGILAVVVVAVAAFAIGKNYIDGVLSNQDRGDRENQKALIESRNLNSVLGKSSK